MGVAVKTARLLKLARKRIAPSIVQEKRIKELSDKIMQISDKLGIRAMLCGSVEKGTWLAGKNELDIFILFEPSVPRKILVERGMELSKKIIKKLKGKYEIGYAEHPYLRGAVAYKKTNYKMDIVPCYDIEDPSKLKSAVDRTPHHVVFVKNNLPEESKNEVRLLKKFCDANDCYGADVKTQGFSGYLCELLIIYYKSFLSLAEDAGRWQIGKRIDILNSSQQKFESPLIVIDPVDPKRNVAAAVGPEVFSKFAQACREFVSSPSLQYFFPKKIKPLSVKQILNIAKERKTKWFILKFRKPDIVEDTLWPQMRKSINRIQSIIEENGFAVMRKDFFIDKKNCYMLFESSIWKISKTYKHIGPNIYAKEQVKGFLSRYRKQKTYIEDKNWIVELERKYLDIEGFLKNFIKKPVKKLREQGISGNIAPKLYRCKVITGKQMRKSLGKMKDFRKFLRKYFERDLNIF